MFYKEEKYYVLGEQFLAVDFGDEGTVKENIYSLVITQRLMKASIPGIYDVLPLTCSLMIGYDPYRVKYLELIDEIKKWTKELREKEGEIQIPSKIVTLPVLYNDKWTRECAEQFGVTPNLEVAAEYNGLSTDEFIKIHTSQTYWVKAVGFAPGLAGFISLSPERELRAPRYKKPRTWTPARTLGLGGKSNCVYPQENPGGAQMLGRVAAPVFDFEGRNPAFKNDPVLLKSGTRIKLISITEKEYDEIERNSDTYEYQIEEGTFVFELRGEEND